MAISRQQFMQLFKDGELKKLFVQVLGWDNDKYSFTEKINEESFACECLAEKSGFKIVVIKPSAATEVPVYATRKKISNAITKRFRENLIIFTGSTGKKQLWHYTVRKTGKPALSSEIQYHTGQSPELLFQKLQGIFFDLDEQDNITIIDVSQRVGDSFEKNAKQVVKKFYRDFQQQHRGFLKFIKGIKEEVNQEWYASLMLNRLMFCYFIQKKGFLNNDFNYLQNKLEQCSDQFGKDKFYSFYRTFLLTLFHKGLGSPADERSKKELDLLGNIPYLNGGLFDEHIIEQENDSIEIKDEAFKAVFGFFDEWNWYLDTREHATGNNINPDVIGYIFEQYINDRAQMGAYYTREDITDYISKNCLFPWLIEETARNHTGPFEKTGEFFTMIKNSGDQYIYPALKHGISWDVYSGEELDNAASVPKEIAGGIDTGKPKLLERRQQWNSTATADAALPTEIWREVMERRSRYEVLMQTITDGGIAHINDCITYNLDISQIVIDWLDNTADPRAIKHFYEALTKVSVLDPTCGSGAFLFAALNLLEPLYAICLKRMHSFVEEEDRQNAVDKKTFKNAHDFFRKTLSDVKQDTHPNEEYFIYKTIILRNLYGVDIMNEAVEIAKLRLFLKLVATVSLDSTKPNLGLEPLPDIDFNIRCGNTLIGFATMAQMKEGLRYDLEGQTHVPVIEEQCSLIAKAFEHFKKIQLSYGDDHKSFVAAKRHLQQKLDELNDSLNTFLAKTYGILDKEKIITIDVKEGKETKKKRVNQYNHWLHTHFPFHWLAEYYEIIVQRGGFDVIIGNPPYLELNQIKYEVKNFESIESRAIHCMCIERSAEILSKKGNISMIVPMALVCTKRMLNTQVLIERQRKTWYLNFAWRPNKLFETVNRALTIFVSNSSNDISQYSTNYYKWRAEVRDKIFENISLNNTSRPPKLYWIPKETCDIEKSIMHKFFSQPKRIKNIIIKNSDHKIYYRTTGGLYWKVFTSFQPDFFLNGKKSSSSRETYISLSFKSFINPLLGVLSSNLFWWWYTISTNLRDLNPSDIEGFPINDEILADSSLDSLGQKLMKDYLKNSTMLVREQARTGSTETQSFKISNSKPIIDEIDKVLAKHFNLTEEELDFIINYDIKYRMGLGKADNGEEEEE